MRRLVLLVAVLSALVLSPAHSNSGTLAVRWSLPLVPTYPAFPADVLPQPGLEVVCVNDTLLLILSRSGRAVWSLDVGSLPELVEPLDVDSDGLCELLVIASSRLLVVDPNDATVLERDLALGLCVSLQPPVVGGEVIGVWWNFTHVLVASVSADSTRLLYARRLASREIPLVARGVADDFDGDGSLEVLVVIPTVVVSAVPVFREDVALIDSHAQITVTTPSVAGVGTVVVYAITLCSSDVDCDSLPEVLLWRSVCGDVVRGCLLHVVNAPNLSLETRSLDACCVSWPVALDVDLDGLYEVAVALDSTLLIMDEGGECRIALPSPSPLAMSAVVDADGDLIPDIVQPSGSSVVVVSRGRVACCVELEGLVWSVCAGDVDGDGLAELIVTTNSSVALVDCAGPARGVVWGVGGDATRRRRLTDTDGDLLPDFIEDALGTDKTRKDTDGDGLSDGAEVYITHTDPLDSDTDDDGLPDGVDPDPLTAPGRRTDFATAVLVLLLVMAVSALLGWVRTRSACPSLRSPHGQG